MVSTQIRVPPCFVLNDGQMTCDINTGFIVDVRVVWQDHESGFYVVRGIMKPSQVLESHRADIRRIVASHRAVNARVFGSVVHGDDTEDSDLDILVDPTSETTLMDVAAIQVELEVLLGVPVDVLTPKALPEKFRSRVISEAIPV